MASEVGDAAIPFSILRLDILRLGENRISSDGKINQDEVSFCIDSGVENCIHSSIE